MTVAAMCTENDILHLQIGTDANGNRLLTDIGVTGAVNQSALMRASQLLFATANEQHLAVEGQELLLVQTGNFLGPHEDTVYHPGTRQARASAPTIWSS